MLENKGAVKGRGGGSTMTSLRCFSMPSNTKRNIVIIAEMHHKDTHIEDDLFRYLMFRLLFFMTLCFVKNNYCLKYYSRVFCANSRLFNMQQ